MPAAMTLISSQTLGSAVASVTFGSGGTLTQAYRDLILVANWGSTAGGGDNLIQFNADTSNTYTNVEMAGNGTSPSSSAYTRTGIEFSYVNAAYSNVVTITQIMDYSVTDKHKTTLHRENGAAYATVARAGRWPSTSAITSIVINAGSSTFTAGSTFMLYGIAG